MCQPHCLLSAARACWAAAACMDRCNGTHSVPCRIPISNTPGSLRVLGGLVMLHTSHVLYVLRVCAAGNCTTCAMLVTTRSWDCPWAQASWTSRRPTSAHVLSAACIVSSAYALDSDCALSSLPCSKHRCCSLLWLCLCTWAPAWLVLAVMGGLLTGAAQPGLTGVAWASMGVGVGLNAMHAVPDLSATPQLPGA